MAVRKKTTERISVHCFLSCLFLVLGVFITGCGEWGLLPSFRVQASPCRDSSCCQAEALGHGLWSAGSGAQAQAVVSHRFSCPEAGGPFPDQGSNPCPQRGQVDC